MVTVTDVLPKSRCEAAGIKAGDVLVSINEKNINDVLDYRFFLAEKIVCLKFLREGKENQSKSTKNISFL